MSIAMAVRRYQDLIAWQLAQLFKSGVFQLLERHPELKQEFKFRSQLIESSRGISKHIAEGFLRYAPRDFARLLGIAAGSLGESEEHLKDGIELEYFTQTECEPLFRLARRCLPAIIKLKASQKRFEPDPQPKPPRRPSRRRPPDPQGDP